MKNLPFLIKRELPPYTVKYDFFHSMKDAKKMPRRVVITSIGVCSSLGSDSTEIISNLKNRKPRFERASFDKSVVICPITGFNIKDITGPFKNRRYLNRGARFSVASAVKAIKKANISKQLLSKAGLFIGVGPNLDIGGEFPEIKEGKIDRKDLMALWILRFLPNTAASAIAFLSGIHGENATMTTACTASLQAMGEAFRKIKDGYLDLAFAGGGDSRLSKGGILAYKKAQALYQGKKAPGEASRPFDNTRSGFIPGEGGAFFLFEELEHAKRRGASIHAEVCGFGTSIDGKNMTAPDPDGRWEEKAILSAMREAEMSPHDIDVVSAHGTSTSLNDDMEAALIERIYGNHRPLVIALKSWIGHAAAACGALELSICLACLQNSFLPEIRNLKEPCHPKLNAIIKGRKSVFNTVLIENFGFGGQNCALIIQRI